MRRKRTEMVKAKVRVMGLADFASIVPCVGGALLRHESGTWEIAVDIGVMKAIQRAIRYHREWRLPVDAAPT